MKQHPDTIEVVARITTEWNQEKAQAGVVNALQANPDISFIFTSSDFLFPSIVSALLDGGQRHHISGGADRQRPHRPPGKWSRRRIRVEEF